MEKKNCIEKGDLVFWITGLVVLLFGKSILKVGFTTLFKLAKFLVKGIFIY